MLVLDGCVQPAMSPNINAATARVLDALGVQLINVAKAGCCGALRHHLNDQEAALDDMRRNIDAWWPYVETVEAIVMTASGCGATVKEYGHLLAHDARYAAKAQRIAELARDLCEILPAFETELAALVQGRITERVVYHPPCTLQHGQQIRGRVEQVLRAVGVDVRLCADSHLCCGSAGTYSILQPALSQQLRDNKVAAAGSVRAGRDRVGQYRLPQPFAVGHRGAGAALDRTDRCGAGPSILKSGLPCMLAARHCGGATKLLAQSSTASAGIGRAMP